MGGVTGFMQAATLCEAYHQPVSSHLFMEASCHLLAAVPNGLILEHMAPSDLPEAIAAVRRAAEVTGND